MSRSRLTLGLRTALAAALTLAVWSVVHRRAGDGLAGAARDVDGYSDAIAWDPSNPDYYVQRAARLRERLREEDLRAAVRDLQTAVRLNPHNWLYWGELAGLLEISGDPAAAENAYREAVRLSPLSGYTHWNLANFLLRRGEREQWLKALGEAVAREFQYQQAAAGLLLKSGVSAREWDAIWPDDRASLLMLGRFLVERRSGAVSDAASHERFQSLWDRLLQDPRPLTPAEADYHLRYLVEEGRFQELRSCWSQLMAQNGFQDEAFAEKRNYVWDGGLETPPCDRGLCWIVEPTDDERVDWITGAGEDFTRLVRIEFLGQSNKEFRNLRQTVVVDPGARYEFSFRARSERIESDKGIYFQILDPATSESVRTEEVLGTSPWTRRTVRFSVAPGSQVLLIHLQRDRSRRLAGKLSGTLWIDDVELRRVGE